jgi:hypothetical protein
VRRRRPGRGRDLRGSSLTAARPRPDRQADGVGEVDGGGLEDDGGGDDDDGGGDDDDGGGDDDDGGDDDGGEENFEVGDEDPECVREVGADVPGCGATPPPADVLEDFEPDRFAPDRFEWPDDRARPEPPEVPDGETTGASAWCCPGADVAADPLKAA